MWWWRSPFAATEDRNTTAALSASSTQMWRSPFAATEDRNLSGAKQMLLDTRWRSPCAATEDRNIRSGTTKRPSGRVAVAHQGDRGSQRRRGGNRHDPVAVALLGDRGSQHVRRVSYWKFLVKWRSPSAATEDRNHQRAAVASPFPVTQDRNAWAAGLAQRYYVQAARLGDEAGDPLIRATALRSMAGDRARPHRRGPGARRRRRLVGPGTMPSAHPRMDHWDASRGHSRRR